MAASNSKSTSIVNYHQHYYNMLVYGYFRSQMKRTKRFMPEEIQDICVAYTTEIKEENIKCILIGDNAVGKSSLLISYRTGEFPHEYIPTVFDNYCKTVLLDEKWNVQLGLWDTTCGIKGYDRLRPLSYPGTNVVLVLYSIVSKSSYVNIKTKWVPEIKHHIPETIFIIVGTKIDLRNDPFFLQKNGESLQMEDGLKLAKEVGAECYLECSALTMDGVNQLFERVVRIGVKLTPKKKKNACMIL
eukprot:76644_1